jgi:cysteinyl-tRNA synthetase
LVREVHELRNKFLEHMDDDFNTGAAISVLFDSLRLFNRHMDAHDLRNGASAAEPAVRALNEGLAILRELTGVLGLFLKPPVDAGNNDRGTTELVDGLMQLFIRLRKEAREAKDYALGDKIRNGLTEVGVSLLDKKDGTSWERRS